MYVEASHCKYMPINKILGCKKHLFTYSEVTNIKTFGENSAFFTKWNHIHLITEEFTETRCRCSIYLSNVCLFTWQGKTNSEKINNNSSVFYSTKVLFLLLINLNCDQHKASSCHWSSTVFFLNVTGWRFSYGSV